MGWDGTDFELLSRIVKNIQKLVDNLIPEMKDVSKYLKEAKELSNKGKPPRRQPKKKGRTIEPNFYAGGVSTS